MSTRPLRADAARNYERIVSAAVVAFEEVGPEATLEQIAEQAGVSVMTLYRRFRNRDQLIQAVFDHLLATEIEPVVTARTDDPWQDLVDALATVTDVLVRRQAIHSLALEFQTFAGETARHFLHSMQHLLSRAIDAEAVRPELEVRDLVAVIVMTMATVHPGDPHGADRRRYLALLADGLRPSTTALPPPSSHEVPGPPVRGR
ncbi:TetR/AcrR family transcriptional regulator [Streptomyces sp. NPDC059866]|uniref:TetR/AcrR family transcriptional regulator n=1 Tax=Streptomyces sp. NPDC059866 TaxID=3346978 RepID=UPI0036671B5F